MKSPLMIGLSLLSLFVPQPTLAQQLPASTTLSGHPTRTVSEKADTLLPKVLRLDTVRMDTVRATDADAKSPLDQLEIDRLVIDETISKAGYDFSELFNSLWTWPETSSESFIMVIAERPYRGISTQIRITVNDLVVFESFLQSRYDYMEEMVAIAVEQVGGYLASYAEIMKELGGEDFKGTGIY